MRIFPEIHVFVVVSVGAIHPVVGKEDTVAGMDDTEAEMEGIVADMATVGGNLVVEPLARYCFSLCTRPVLETGFWGDLQ